MGILPVHNTHRITVGVKSQLYANFSVSGLLPFTFLKVEDPKELLFMWVKYMN